MTNATFIASLAYKAAVIRLMLPEVSFVSEQLNLPTPHPIEMRDVQKTVVGPPMFGFVGAVQTTNYFFSFSDDGKLYAIFNDIKPVGRFDLYPEWAKTPSLVNSNGAYQLATQWLAAINVDVVTLEKKYNHQIEQSFFWNPPGSTNKTMLPIYSVTWGTNYPKNYPAQVILLGTTKELMELRLSESSLSRRPALVVTNAIELNNTDPPNIRHLQSDPAPVESNSNTTTNPPPFRISH